MKPALFGVVVVQFVLATNSMIVRITFPVFAALKVL
jgi:hypothetical protein